MAVRSLAQSSIRQSPQINSMLAGYSGNQFHHLETIRLSGNAASIEFINLARYADYQHLQLRYTEYYSQAGFSTTMRLNGDSGGNYNSHGLWAAGSSVTSSWQGPNAQEMLVNHFGVGHSTDTNLRTVGVVDILDPFDTNKFTTIRSFGGQAVASASLVFLHSGLWRNTASVTDIRMGVNGAPLFATGTRYSLYGLKARA
jgi:hypothetical protein